jgi:uncharacterized protein (DUF2225 family)
MKVMRSAIWSYLLAYLNSNHVEADTASLRQKFSALKIDAVFPQDPNYEKFSASFNRRFTYRPAAIVFPNNTEAVANAVKVGVAEKIPSQVHSNHSIILYFSKFRIDFEALL